MIGFLTGCSQYYEKQGYLPLHSVPNFVHDGDASTQRLNAMERMQRDREALPVR